MIPPIYYSFFYKSPSNDNKHVKNIFTSPSIKQEPSAAPLPKIIALDDEIKKEIADLCKQEAVINNKLKNLKHISKELKFINNVLKSKKWKYTEIEFYNQLVKQITNPNHLFFLNNLLPLSGTARKALFNSISKAYLGIEGVSAFLDVTDAKFTSLVFIYRLNILKEAKEALHELEKETTVSDQVLHKWRARIATEEENLLRQSYRGSLKMVTRIVSHANILLEWVGSYFPTEVINNAIQGCTLATAGLMWMLAASSLYRKTSNYRIYQQWHTQLTSSIPQNNKEVNEVALLYKKREEAIQKQLEETEEDEQTFSPIVNTFYTNQIEAKKTRLQETISLIKDVHEKMRKGQMTLDEVRNALSTRSIYLPPSITFPEAILHFKSLLKSKREELTHCTTDARYKERCLYYILHKQTLSTITKSVLTEWTVKKGLWEKTVLRFKLFESSTLFTVLTATLVVAATLAILGLTFTPIGFIITISLSVLALSIGLGFSLASILMARRKNSSVLKKGLNSVENQMTWQQMFIDFSSYKLEMNRKRMTKTAHALKELQDHNQSIDQQTLNNYKQARQNYLEQKKHVAKLKKQCESLEKQKNEASWQDFAKYAHLSNQTDALELLIQALIELDSKNLETQQFLKKYFKIDSKKMQDMPLETASAYIKQKLFQFFDLNDSNFVHLLREQKLAI